MVKNKKEDTDKDFSSANRFEILQDDIKENDHDSIDNNKDKRKTRSNRNTKTKGPTAVNLGSSILKNVYGHTISKAAKFNNFNY